MHGVSRFRYLLLVVCLAPAMFLAACGGSESTSPSSSSLPADVQNPGPTPSPTPAPTPTPGDGTITVSWDSPTTSVDQTCLTDLSGYRISYGVASRNYTASESVMVNAAACVDSGTEPVAGCGNTRICTYTVRGFGSGTWYLAVQAYDNAGNLSNFSNEVVRTLP